MPPVRLAFRLHRFLQRVQMDENGVGLKIVNSPLRQINAAGRRQLDTAKIADERHRRRMVAERRLRSARLDAGAL